MYKIFDDSFVEQSGILPYWAKTDIAGLKQAISNYILQTQLENDLRSPTLINPKLMKI